MAMVFAPDCIVNMFDELLSRFVEKGPMVNGIAIVPICESKGDNSVDELLPPCFPSNVWRRFAGFVGSLAMSLLRR